VGTRELAETGIGGVVRPSLLRVLADAGVASEEDLRLAFVEATGSGERFGEVVLRRGWLNDDGLAAALAEQRGLSHVSHAEADFGAVALLGGAGSAAELGACPIRSADGRLLVAVAEPSNDRLRAVRTAIGAEPDFAVVTVAVLERLLGFSAEVERTAESAAAEARASRIADDEHREASLRRLDEELEAATAQLIRLRRHVGELVASDERHQRELSDCRAHIERLSETNAEHLGRIGALEAELARQRERIATARKKLSEAGESLDG